MSSSISSWTFVTMWRCRPSHLITLMLLIGFTILHYRLVFHSTVIFHVWGIIISNSKRASKSSVFIKFFCGAQYTTFQRCASLIKSRSIVFWVIDLPFGKGKKVVSSHVSHVFIKFIGKCCWVLFGHFLGQESLLFCPFCSSLSSDYLW
jgi:hypothetical protein